MSRGSWRGLVGLSAVVLAAVAVMAAPSLPATAAQSGRVTAKSGWTPLLSNWGINLESVHATHQFSIILNYIGGDWTSYPQISKKTDSVPYLKIYLTLPTGASITKWNVRRATSKECRGNPRPLSSTTWYWPCKGLPYALAVYFNYTVDWGTATTECMKAVAHPLYYKRVKTKGGHYAHVLRPIPHAPVEVGYNDPYAGNGGCSS